MRTACASWSMALLATGLGGAVARAQDVHASAPTALSVTVYRAPARTQGAMTLDGLAGFALVSEQRTVELPAGDSRVVFDGVADGIDPASAIVTGLPGEVIEKNRDAALLSPGSLLARAVGKPLTLVRTDRATGKATYIAGTLRAAPAVDDGAPAQSGGERDVDGVVFESAQGLEALRCSGLPETFQFTSVAGLSAQPTLSVEVHSPLATTATVTLSYLSAGFDWGANYVAHLSDDGRLVDLGAWVTLANGNAAGFPAAQTQVVAGRLNKQSEQVEPIIRGAPVLAECWPRGTTSDPASHRPLEDLTLYEGQLQEMLVTASRRKAADFAVPAPMAMMAPPPVTVVQEDLGDLKLYRVPEPTTVASRQSKQVRLLDRTSIPVRLVYGLDVWENQTIPAQPASRLLRTRNDVAHHLGLPLPSGSVATFVADRHATVLVGEAGLRDVAVGEEFDIALGTSPDVQVSATLERLSLTGRERLPAALTGAPGLKSEYAAVNRVVVRNAAAHPVEFELRVMAYGTDGLAGADRPYVMRNGRPLFTLHLDAGATQTVRYQTTRTANYLQPPR